MSKTGRVISWIVRGIGIFILLMVVTGTFAYCARPGEAPAADKAPYAFQTYSQDEMKIPSRIYYSKAVEMVDNCPVIGPGYWTFDGKGYNYHKGTMELPENTKVVIRK